MCDWRCSTGQCCENDTCVGSCPGCKSCVSNYCEDNDDNCSTCKECCDGDCVLKSTSECDNDEWRPSPAPTGTISCTNGQKWDHINDAGDSIPLALNNAEDKDDKCVNCQWETQTDNYIETDDTLWDCSGGEGYCFPTTGSTTEWYATSTAQPTWVRAKLVDSSTDPDPDADDDDEWTEKYTDLHGFKVGVRANFNGAWEDNGTAWEGDSYSYSGTTAVHHIANSKGASAPGEDEESDYFYVCFEYKTDPSDAEPAGDVHADLEIGFHAYWSGYHKDCDILDEEGDSVGIFFGLAGYGVGGGLSYSWTLEDGQESICAGDWAYTTDTGLGGNHVPSGEPMFCFQSGDCADDLETDYEISMDLSRSATKEWEKGSNVRGQFDISTATYAIHCDGDYAQAHFSMTSPVVKIDNVEYSP